MQPQMQQAYQQPMPMPQAFGGGQMPVPDPAPAFPMQGMQQPQMSAEQLNELAITDPVQAITYIAEQRAAAATQQALAQIVPALAPLIEGQNRSDAAATISRLQGEFGDETVKRHRNALAEAVASDEQYFLDEGTRYQRLSSMLKALEYDRRQHPSAAQPRQVGGQFAPRQAHHTEGGSDGHNPPGAGGSNTQETDPDLADWDDDRPQFDRFGAKAPVRAENVRRMAG